MADEYAPLLAALLHQVRGVYFMVYFMVYFGGTSQGLFRGYITRPISGSISRPVRLFICCARLQAWLRNTAF